MMDFIAFGNILYISRAFHNYRRQKKPDASLMPSETLFIHYIHQNPGCTQDQIVKYTGMDKTTVAHRLNKIEEMGYVRREVSAEDARKRHCFLTEKGEAAYPQMHEQYLQFKKQVLKGFTEDELLMLDRMTSRMKQNAEKLITEQEKKS